MSERAKEDARLVRFVPGGSERDQFSEPAGR